jgi:outer membrane lipoprotein-sorting protein
MLKKLYHVTTGIVLAISIGGSAAAIEVDEIVAKANATAYYQGDDGRAKVNMVITDDQGRTRTRAFTILRKDKDAGATSGDQLFYIHFSRPADVSKTSFLVWKHVTADDDRWLYLPALDLVKRIAASDKRSSFVGSHFFYEDVSGRNPDLDTHVLAEESDTYHVLESTPKDKGSVEFASYKSWIHKTTFLAVKIEYQDRQGEVYRTYEALGVEMIDGHPTVTSSRMTDHTRGGATSMTYEDVRYDTGLADDIFSERYLRNPPRKLLR